MRVNARADYAIRAMVQLAAAGPAGVRVKGERIARAQRLSVGFVENILGVLRSGRLVDSRRGSEGGYWLARPAEEITIADVLRVVDGPLTLVLGRTPDALEYPAAAASVRDVWLGVEVAVRRTLESVTIADVAAGAVTPTLPPPPPSRPQSSPRADTP